MKSKRWLTILCVGVFCVLTTGILLKAAQPDASGEAVPMPIVSPEFAVEWKDGGNVRILAAPGDPLRLVPPVPLSPGDIVTGENPSLQMPGFTTPIYNPPGNFTLIIVDQSDAGEIPNAVPPHLRTPRPAGPAAPEGWVNVAPKIKTVTTADGSLLLRYPLAPIAGPR